MSDNFSKCDGKKAQASTSPRRIGTEGYGLDERQQEAAADLLAWQRESMRVEIMLGGAGEERREEMSENELEIEARIATARYNREQGIADENYKEMVEALRKIIEYKIEANLLINPHEIKDILSPLTKGE